MPLIGLEPIRNYNSMDFKSIVSTNSTTVARNDIWKGERVVMGYSGSRPTCTPVKSFDRQDSSRNNRVFYIPKTVGFG